jgi:glycerophosphoryl diester phosphodiesterase
MAYASDAGRRPVEIIGHRGSPRVHRENTIPSFLQAFQEGAVAVELDVHGTRDGVVVVHHDAATNSRPGDAGEIRVIAESSWSDVRAIPIAGAPMPTLDETLAVVPDSATVYVEIKARGIEAAVVAAIRSGQRHCAVHSFDHRVARRVHELASDIPVGVLQTGYPIDPIRPIRDAGARDLWQHWEMIDESLIQRVHDDGGRVIAWTVNQEPVAERLLAWGVDGICSDTPAIMRRVADNFSRAQDVR